MKPSCPRCGNPLDAADYCPSCAFGAVLDDSVASAFPLEQEETAERIAKRRQLIDLEPVGRGGMGFVFRARQVQLDREIALKLFAAGSPERFEREARLLASLSHPNIVAIHDFGAEDGRPYFMMEYMDGPSVRTLIDMGGMSQRRALEIVEQVGRALEYAHGRGVIHRDIKPENVLTSVDGTVKVGDFGIARLSDQEGDTGGATGTPEYMAPERQHIPGAADERSDIYSLGALAREMLGSTGPIDDRLDDLLRRALEPDPTGRFQSATEFLAAVRGISEHVSTAPPRLAMPVRMKRLSLSRFFWFFLTGSLIEMLVLFCLLIFSPPADPQQVFERLQRGADPWIHEGLRTLRSAPTVEVDAMLIREAGSPDPRRAEAAFHAALNLGRIRILSPETRLRIMNQADWDTPKGWWPTSIQFEPHREPLLLETFLEGGPSLARYQLEELASGRCAAPKRGLAVRGIALAADGALILEMRRRLLADPSLKDPYAVLCALAARTDLPLPESESVMPVFLRHLPDLLDPKTGEARWEAAVNLALDLPKGDGRRNADLPAWRSLYVPEGASPGSVSIESLLKYRKHLSWPMDSAAADRLEQQLRDPDRVAYSYFAAVLLRWHRSGIRNLPLYPYRANSYYRNQIAFGIVDSLRRERFATDVLAILPQGRGVSRWECLYLDLTTLAGKLEVQASASGVGPVDFSTSFENLRRGHEATLHFGVGSLVPREKKSPLRAGSFTMKGDFKFDTDGTLRFNGSYSVRDAWGGGSGSADGRGQGGEAMVIRCNGFSARTPDLRFGYGLIMLPDPPPVADVNSRWRLAVSQGLKRLSSKTLGISEKYDVGRLVSVGVWAPMPEAMESLRALWGNRAEFSDQRSPDNLSLSQSDAIGAALLMAGDTLPLEDTGLIDRLKPDHHSRLFLFCPNPTIRTAVEGKAAQILGRIDAEEVARVLAERGDTTSPLALAAAEGVSKGRRRMFLDMLPYLAGFLGILVLGWFPRGRGYMPAVAGSLAFTGLAIRLLKFEVAGRMWIPVVGDLLLMISAFMYGGRAMRALTTGLVLCGILQLMNPESDTIGMASVLLLCVYLGATTLDGLVRWLPARVSRRFGFAFLVTWWLVIIPSVIPTAVGMFFFTSGQVSAQIIKVTGVFTIPFAVALVLPALWLAHFERRRRLAERLAA